MARKTISIDDDTYFCPDTWGAVDVESTGTQIHRGCKPFIVSITDCKADTHLFRVDVDPFTRQPFWPKKKLSQITELLNSLDLLVFHNAKFDIRMLASIGIELSGRPFWDTILGCHLRASSEPPGLKDQSILHLDTLDSELETLRKAVISASSYGRKKNWNLAGGTDCNYWVPREVAKDSKLPKDHVFWDAATKYGGKDTFNTSCLYLLQREHPRIKNSFHLLKREFALVAVVRKMEEYGVSISPKRLEPTKQRFDKMLADAEKKCLTAAKLPELNIRSPQQLNKLLFDDWGIRPTRQTKTGYSTDAKSIRNALAQQLVLPERKQRPKVITFLEGLIAYGNVKASANYLAQYKRECINGRLFASFNQMGARSTTRFSCSDPNVQNIGKGKELDDGETDFILRYVFGPKPGRVWYDFDFDQLQLRIFATAAQEQSILDAFDAGWDFHNFVASRLFHTEEPTKLQRRIAKNVNFALIFGAGRAKVDATAGQPGTYDRYRKQFPCIDRYMDAVIRQVRKRGYVRTLSGYALDVPAASPYVGVNYIVQGTEGDIAKYAMLYTDEVIQDERFVRYDIHLTNFVHDELIFDSLEIKSKKLLRLIPQAMERAGRKVGVKTPAAGDIIRKSWDKGEKLELAL